MTTITLKNDFHNTSVNIRCRVVDSYDTSTAYLSAGQIKRAKLVLCGVSGCCCSRADGTRGKQDIDGKTLEVDLTAFEAWKSGYETKGTR